MTSRWAQLHERPECCLGLRAQAWVSAPPPPGSLLTSARARPGPGMTSDHPRAHPPFSPSLAPCLPFSSTAVITVGLVSGASSYYVYCTGISSATPITWQFYSAYATITLTTLCPNYTYTQVVGGGGAPSGPPGPTHWHPEGMGTRGPLGLPALLCGRPWAPQAGPALLPPPCRLLCCHHPAACHPPPFPLTPPDGAVCRLGAGAP